MLFYYFIKRELSLKEQVWSIYFLPETKKYILTFVLFFFCLKYSKPTPYLLNAIDNRWSFFPGAKWEWGSTALSGSNGSNASASEWHIYDMEVQTVIEEAWAHGEQTIDIGQHFPGCPYIINFCNLTQVRRTTGIVRPIRRYGFCSIFGKMDNLFSIWARGKTILEWIGCIRISTKNKHLAL